MTLNNEQKRNLWILGIMVVLIILGMNAQRLGFFGIVNIDKDVYHIGDNLILTNTFTGDELNPILFEVYLNNKLTASSRPKLLIILKENITQSFTSRGFPITTNCELSENVLNIKNFNFTEEHSGNRVMLKIKTYLNDGTKIACSNIPDVDGGDAKIISSVKEFEYQVTVIGSETLECIGNNILQVPIECPLNSESAQVVKEYQCINNEWKLTKDENCIAVGLPTPTTNGTIDSGVKIITLTGTKLVIERNGVIETIDIPQDEDNQRVIIQKEGNPIIQSFMIGKLSLNTILLLIGLIILITLGFRFRKIRLKR